MSDDSDYVSPCEAGVVSPRSTACVCICERTVGHVGAHRCACGHTWKTLVSQQGA